MIQLSGNVLHHLLEKTR